jgi:hypothetical protein
MNPVKRAVEAYKKGGAGTAAPLFALLTTPEKRQYFLQVKEFKESLKKTE